MRLLVSFCLVSFSVFAQQTVIEISGANFRPSPLAIVSPVLADGSAQSAAAEFDEALVFDLKACGLFNVLDRKSFLADPKEGLDAALIQFQKWTDVGAESLVKTQIAKEADTVRGELHVFSVAPGREDLKVSETSKNARALAHKLANVVYKYFTKETGPFETRLTWSRKTPTGRDVYVGDWDGKNAQRVATGDVSVLPALIPNTPGAVAFTSYRPKKPFLFVARGTEITQLIAKGNMVTGVAFSPNGKQLAVSISEGEVAEIFVANADGANLTKITDTKFFLNTSPSWSPDSKRLAFVSNRAGGPQVFMMNADGGNVKRLTFQGSYNTTPAFSPRGDLVAFTARDEKNAFDIFTVNLENQKVTRLTQGAKSNEEPTFSPNGRLIIFTSTRSGARVPWVMTFDGNNQMPLPVERGDYATPDWNF
jgi:TolB protein